MLHRSLVCLVTGFSLVVLPLVQPLLAADAPQRKLLVADSSKSRIALLDEAGKTTWEYKIGPLHDFQVLPNGNLLFQTNWTRLLELDLKENKAVWEYDSSKQNGNAGKPVEVHAFQRLADGSTMIAESGPGRIIEVDAAGKLLHEVKLKIPSPSAHHDTRLVRKLESGNYLVAHEQEGMVREYDKGGQTVWEYAVPLFDQPRKGGHGPEGFGNQCYAAIRLANGNTLIATGNGHSVLEVTPQKEVVWSVKQTDLPGITLAWVTTLQVLPSGNIVIGNCHAGPQNPQVIEITREKQVVWKLQDFDRFGNSTTNSWILAVDGQPVK